MIPNSDPVVQALLASLFTWGVTALGAALVFVLPSNNKYFLDISLGFAGGVMTAASFWSLLAPAIKISDIDKNKLAFMPVAIGFAVGALFVHLSDKLIPSCVVAEISLINVLSKNCHNHKISKNDNDHNGIGDSKTSFVKRNLLENNASSSSTEMKEPADYADPSSSIDSTKISYSINPDPLLETSFETSLSWRRILLLIMAVTVHNIPEGLAVGVSFGSINKTSEVTFENAFNLALGIGVQNFPEGLAVSLPLSGFGYSKLKSFFYGQLSGMVEPLAALLGAAAVLLMEPILPFALSFAAGAMIYVVFDDIVPEAQRNGNGKSASVGAILGFLIMMCLDVGMG